MTPAGKRLSGTAGVVGAGALCHVGPAVTAIPRVRRTLSPALSGIGSPGHVALTFDDGPDPASTPQILRALDELGWTATFFMLGSMARQVPSLAAEVAAAGHEVGVHGDLHHSHLLKSPRWVLSDSRRAVDGVGAATGTLPEWFRPPYGALSAATLLAARREGLRCVLWSAWGRDWRAGATAASVVEDVEKGLSPGATVLLHDSDCTSAPAAWRSALGALPGLAETFAERRMEVGPLGEHGVARNRAAPAERPPARRRPRAGRQPRHAEG